MRSLALLPLWGKNSPWGCVFVFAFLDGLVLCWFVWVLFRGVIRVAWGLLGRNVIVGKICYMLALVPNAPSQPTLVQPRDLFSSFVQFKGFSCPDIACRKLPQEITEIFDGSLAVQIHWHPDQILWLIHKHNHLQQIRIHTRLAERKI